MPGRAGWPGVLRGPRGSGGWARQPSVLARRGVDGRMSGEGYATRRRPRYGLIALLVGLHGLVLLGLARAFAPDFTAAVIEEATSLVTVTVTSPPPPPEPQPSPEPSPQPNPQPSPARDEGAAAEPAPEAVPREVTAPAPPIVLVPPQPVPPAPSTGSADTAGALDAGAGTGAGGEGAGTGSGRGGAGQGGGGQGGAVSRPMKIAGDINNAADYPIPAGGRDIRLGHSVTISMTVTPEGRAENCRVVEPSPDPVADRITCELAQERFRFEPARNAAGEAVAATYGWRQAWFRK